ncbi:hypothetical protein CDD81_355 [Ophiocordyceps australis]|uniref:Zn(2)-C6 fungal-type domain-containing protein n=1 Tax=Ophiocordyceps australis TaxID=1399860 RepID=A0A2C5XYB5_9HYPO|nr:hypothetical protein CDD81_355 [Ophiocordyceps australis]
MPRMTSRSQGLYMAGDGSGYAASTAARALGPRKGCHTCNKRRIRCDLTEPRCKKCDNKGLECPGYGPRLRWAGGVAVRGRLKGHKVPLLGSQDASLLAGPGQDASLLAGPGQEASGGEEREQQDRSSSRPSSASSSASSFGSAISISPASLDRTLRRSAREFIEYYDKNIAGLMVWFDSENNDYRRRVLPRAANTPGLRLAVAAIAAHHGGLTFDHEVPRFSEAARDACLGLIQSHVRDMTGRLTDGSELTSQSDVADAEWMLAAILMISTYEMANAQAVAAESHRMAARTIVNVFGHHEACRTRTFDFLSNQLAVLDVFCSTTSFDMADVEHTVLPPASMADAMFADYLCLLHRVTHASRQAHDSPSSSRRPPAQPLTARWIRHRFHQARGATLLAAGRLQIRPSAASRDFIRLVDIYHYAAILYSYRCLGLVEPEQADRLAATLHLFEQLAALEAPTLCAQNLPWPVFVAGTECHGHGARQEFVARLFTTMASATGFGNMLDVLKFLRMFWAGGQADWQPLARRLQRNGFRILAV